MSEPLFIDSERDLLASTNMLVVVQRISDGSLRLLMSHKGIGKALKTKLTVDEAEQLADMLLHGPSAA